MAVPPPPPYYGRAWRPDYYLHIVKLPCDRAAAAAAARGAAASMRRSSIISMGVLLIFIGFLAVILSQMMSFTSTIPFPGQFGLFVLLVLGFMALILGVMAWSALRVYRLAGSLEGLASAIESGLMSESDYCDKTLYQALITYQARTQYTRALGQTI